jgi:hypothetical protein
VNSDLIYKILDEKGNNLPTTLENLKHFTKLFNEVLDLNFDEAFIQLLKN